MAETETHQGSCHCGAVSFEVDTDLDGLMECNCSHCYRKGFVLAFVEPTAFRLKSNEDAQTHYAFNKHMIDHQFCSTCGVQTFGSGKGPDGKAMVAVNVRALTDVEPWDWEAKRVDGRSF